MSDQTIAENSAEAVLPEPGPDDGYTYATVDFEIDGSELAATVDEVPPAGGGRVTTDPRDRYWPLLVLGLFAVPAAIVMLMAPSAAADPGAPADVDEVFLEALRIYGITGESDAGLIDAGHAVCDLYAEGTSGSDAVAAVNAANPTLTPSQGPTTSCPSASALTAPNTSSWERRHDRGA